MKTAPAIFLGHGSPMNALEKNAFSDALTALGERIRKEYGMPTAILSISAHWLTAGTWVTQMEQPRTIHDFYGFPKALFDVRYPAPGSPMIAEQIQRLIHKPTIQLDAQGWGLDHGTWSVLKWLFPKADIPVLQLSLDMSEPASFHFELGEKLRALRNQGVLIVGSGNVVHNLRQIRWGNHEAPFDWAQEFDEWVKAVLATGNYRDLVENPRRTEAGRLSIPTYDHYLPMLYILGAAKPGEIPRTEYEALELGSISMRSFSMGL